MDIKRRNLIFIALLLYCLGTVAVSYGQGTTRLTGTLKVHPWVKTPIAYSNDIGGGLHQVGSIADRDAIPAEKRKRGMLCTVLSGGVAQVFQLIGGTENSNWVPFVSKADNLSLPGGKNVGDMRYWDKATSTWVLIPVGKPGQLLQENPYHMPEWATITAPVGVTTLEVTDVNKTSVKSGGNVSSTGGLPIKVGVCWSKDTSTPTIEDSHQEKDWWFSGFEVDISGLEAGTLYYLRAFARNLMGITYGDPVRTFTTLDIDATKPTVITTKPSAIKKISATLGGRVTSNGKAAIIKRGICWNTTGNPAMLENPTEFSGTTDPFSKEITGFSSGTTYHVKAFATNILGVAYGDEEDFTTLAASATEPGVTTYDIDLCTVNKTSVDLKGKVTGNGGVGIDVEGFCWCLSSEGSPDITDNTKQVAGTAIGDFSATVTGLEAGKTYNMRAFATNLLGAGYGVVKSFTTLPISATAPVNVVTAAPANVTNVSASLGGFIGGNGGAQICERGICWTTSWSGNPTTSDNCIPVTGTTGEFIYSLNSLTRGITYHVRAYAKNVLGTTYGDEEDFVTASQVTTAPITSITFNSAVGGGEVSNTFSGSPSRGVCWSSTSSIPTITTSSVIWNDATGPGSFTSGLTELTPNTYYYVRAFASYDGTELNTYYGDVVGFWTATPAAVTTLKVNTDTGVGGGMVYGLPDYHVYGLIYGEQSVNLNFAHMNPTAFPPLVAYRTDDIFYLTLNNIEAGKTYYVRAFAAKSFDDNDLINARYGSVLRFVSGVTNQEDPVDPVDPSGSAPSTAWSCGASFTEGGITYNTVQTNLSGSSKCWITQNLGASSSSYFGKAYQFGLRKGYTSSSGLLTTLPNSVAMDDDWASGEDPCSLELGNGWRLPTFGEWGSVVSHWGSANDAKQSDLKLYSLGFIDPAGVSGSGMAWYWSTSSTMMDFDEAQAASFLPGSWGMRSSSKLIACPVRCIKD